MATEVPSSATTATSATTVTTSSDSAVAPSQQPPPSFPSTPKSKADKPPKPPDSAPPPAAVAAVADSSSGGSPPPPARLPLPVDSSSSSPPPAPATTETATSAPAAEAPKSSSPKSLTISIPVATSAGLFSYAGATVTAGDGRSFSQLLAGAMASSPLSNRPGTPVLAVPMVAVPCFLAPAGLLDSCAITGQFAMSHQAVLATVTAQAQMQLQAGFSSPTPHQTQFPLSPMPLQQKSPQKSEGNHTSPEITNERQLHGVEIVVKTVSSDGYNWRKYGQKQVKSSDSSRSYYRCTQANCSAKKKVERSSDGRVTEVVYHGEHNHEPPQKGKYVKEREMQSSGAGESEKLEVKNAISEAGTSSKAEKREVNMTSDQLHCSSDCEDDSGSKTEDHNEPDPKRRHCESPMASITPLFRMVREQKIVIEKGCDAGLPIDGFRWRKYGQKIVKGNPNPRSYYKCTYLGCPVRKHVERHSEDAKTVIITYEGNHTHDSPSYRVGSESPATPVRIGAATSAASEGKNLDSASALKQTPSLDSQSRSGAECTDVKPNIQEVTMEEPKEPKAMEIDPSSAVASVDATMEGSKEPKAMGTHLSPGVASVNATDFVNQPIFDETNAAVAVKNA